MDKTLCPFDPQRKTKPILLRLLLGQFGTGGGQGGRSPQVLLLARGEGGGPRLLPLSLVAPIPSGTPGKRESLRRSPCYET